MVERRTKWKIVAVAAVSLIAAGACLLFLMAFQVCRDWAFICTNTASRKGHREWFFGAETGRWYEQSELERFIVANHPGELQHNWVSYAGTGKNIFGRAILCGHGRPGPLIHVPAGLLDAHVVRLDDKGKKALHDLLLTGDQERIGEAIGRIPLSIMYGEEDEAPIQRIGPGSPGDAQGREE
jgi:hypothetical protein